MIFLKELIIICILYNAFIHNNNETFFFLNIKKKICFIQIYGDIMHL